jgi:LPS export ABC transporter protein LptC
MIRGLSNANLINSSAQIFLHDRLRLRLIHLVWVALLFLQMACSNTELKEPLVYTGPLRKAENIELYYSEKDQVKVKMVAAEMQEFESGDREFPKGIYMEFYDEFGMMESTLRANQAYFFKKENQWRGRGKVEVKNIAKNEQLNTEELFWKPGEEKIFTEKFVTIRQQGDVIYGQGLVANQDMSDYIIKEPQGEFDVKEE